MLILAIMGVLSTGHLFAKLEDHFKKVTDKGFGFIKTTGPKDIYFHSSALQGVRFEELQVGQKVSYTDGQSPKGPCAENVTPV